jgi:hypothetical protein
MTENRVLMLLQRGEGRHLRVIGHDIIVKLTNEETAGETYVFEDVCPPGAVFRRMCTSGKTRL